MLTLMAENRKLRAEIAALREAGKNLVLEIDKYPIGTPISSTSIHWFKRIFSGLLEAKP